VVSIRRGREKLHYLNPEPIEAIAERWIGKYERRRVQALLDLKRALEGQADGQPDRPHIARPETAPDTTDQIARENDQEDQDG
jgi:hypothetical protein